MEPVAILTRELADIVRYAIEMLPAAVAAIAVMIATWVAAKIVRIVVRTMARRARLRLSLQELCILLGVIATWLLGLITAAVILFPDLTPGSIVAGLGIGTIAIGFAFKDIFENFFAGIIILLRRSMRIGDFVECGGYEGKVEHINIRETYVRQTDGQLVILPNAQLFKNPLTVLTDQEERRTTIICGVAYGEDVDAARSVIEDAVKGCNSVHQGERPIQVFAKEFADSSINFEVTWWTGSQPIDIRRSRDEVVAAVKRGLDEAGIEIPFPYRTLTFKEPLPVRRTAVGAD